MQNTHLKMSPQTLHTTAPSNFVTQVCYRIEMNLRPSRLVEMQCQIAEL